MMELLARLRADGYHPVTIDAKYAVDGYEAVCDLNVHQTFALMNCMQAVISHDTGTLHMAGTLGVPLVGVFGSIPSEARMTYYKGEVIDTHLACAPCWYQHTCLNNEDPKTHFACMRTVSVDTVMAKLALALQRYTTPRGC